MAGEPWSDHPQCVSPVIAAFELIDPDDRRRKGDRMTVYEVEVGRRAAWAGDTVDDVALRLVVADVIRRYGRVRFLWQAGRS